MHASVKSGMDGIASNVGRVILPGFQTRACASESGWSEYGKIESEENPDGSCKLKNGTKLKMVGVLDDC